MKKYIVMLLVTIMLMGCTSLDVDNKNMKVNTICLDGVTYYMLKEFDGRHSWGYMSVKLDTNSKIVPCEVTE